MTDTSQPPGRARQARRLSASYHKLSKIISRHQRLPSPHLLLDRFALLCQFEVPQRIRLELLANLFSLLHQITDDRLPGFGCDRIELQVDFRRLLLDPDVGDQGQNR